MKNPNQTLISLTEAAHILEDKVNSTLLIKTGNGFTISMYSELTELNSWANGVNSNDTARIVLELSEGRLEVSQLELNSITLDTTDNRDGTHTINIKTADQSVSIQYLS